MLFMIADKIRLPGVSSQTVKQLYRFLCVGVINTIIGYGTYFIALIYINYIVALLVSHVVGVLTSFAGNKLWTFDTNKNVIIEFAKFESTYLVSLSINMALLYIAVDIMRFDPRIVQLVLLPLITVLTFVGHKYWSFGSK